MHTAVEKDNIQIVQLLLSNKKIDINAKTIFNIYFFNSIQKIDFFIEFKYIVTHNDIMKTIFYEIYLIIFLKFLIKKRFI